MFVYLEGSYFRFGCECCLSFWFCFRILFSKTNILVIPADFVSQNLIEVCRNHSRRMLLWMIINSIGVILWYQFTKRQVDLRSDYIFNTSVALWDTLAFLNSFEDLELYFAALSRFFFKQKDAKVIFARDQWLSSNNPSD